MDDRDRSACLRRKGQEKGISLVKGLEGEVHTEPEEVHVHQERPRKNRSGCGAF